MCSVCDVGKCLEGGRGCVTAALTVRARVGVIMFLAEIDKLSMAMRPKQTMCPLGLSINMKSLSPQLTWHVEITCGNQTETS